MVYIQKVIQSSLSQITEESSLVSFPMWTLWGPEENVIFIMFCLYTNALFRCVPFLTQNYRNKHVDPSSTAVKHIDF